MNWDNIDIKSEKVQDIMGRPPKRLQKSGSSAVLVVLLLLLAGAFLFKYPNIVNGEVEIVSSNPPAPVMAYSQGTLASLVVADSQVVKVGELLGVIDNPAQFQDILHLKDLLINKTSISLSAIQGNSALWRLGDVQPHFSGFLKISQEEQDFKESRILEQKIELKKKKLPTYRDYLNNLRRQHDLKKKDLAIGRKQVHRDSMLFSKDMISELEWETTKLKVLEREGALEKADGEMAELKVAIATLEEEILNLQLEKQDRKRQLSNEVSEARSNLLAMIDQWEKKYLLRAPIEGTVTFTKIWSANQKIKEGETVFTIIPHQEHHLIGKVTLPVSGSGKVKTGQSVNLLLDNYPHMEFGMLKGEVGSVSLVPDERGYALEILLPDTLITSYDVQIPFRQSLKGQAQIITEDQRFIERLFSPLRYLVNERLETNL